MCFFQLVDGFLSQKRVHGPCFVCLFESFLADMFLMGSFLGVMFLMGRELWVHWCMGGSLGTLRVIRIGGVVICRDMKILSPLSESSGEIHGMTFLGLDIKRKGMILSGRVAIVTAIKMNPAMGQAADPDKFWRF